MRWAEPPQRPMSPSSGPGLPLYFRLPQALRQQTDSVLAETIACPENIVHVWGFHLDAQPEMLSYWRSLLSTEERQRAERFVQPQQVARWVAAHGLKREVLSHYLQKAAHELRFVALPDGKPVLHQPGHEKWHFNLSHSHQRLLIAVSCSGPVGVDIEYHDPSRPFLALAQRFFHPDEAAAMTTMNETLARTQFYRAWVAKEALLKAQGMGLRGGLSRWPVSATETGKMQTTSWTVHWLTFSEPGFSAAVAMRPENQWCWV
ncbi:MAG: 4'-phosphopantetheinyl transferase superfamily protein [Burkholderiales bacterium]|nr:4'-phosphopantetheinyl transferase superfamily protein [Burkholderiales bacterium]